MALAYDHALAVGEGEADFGAGFEAGFDGRPPDLLEFGGLDVLQVEEAVRNVVASFCRSRFIGDSNLAAYPVRR